MKKISISEMMKAVNRLETEGIRATQFGIGPMSKPVIEATLALAKEKDFPVMFIASRNQIDAQEFGRGYVQGWDQYDFVGAVQEIADKIGFDGLYYICRDHGGPWQRDGERLSKLPTTEAMDIAKLSYLHDLKAGFDLLHIDPTKDPHVEGVVPMEIVLDRTVELIEYVEGERAKLNLPPIAYEVGTEETNGGLTTQDAYACFIRELTERLIAKKLPLPLLIVGQTGTLTRLTQNAGHFDSRAAKELSSEAKVYGVGIKEHNADYLDKGILMMHPALGVTAANVAPEFGVAETDAYLTLAKIEKRYLELGLIGSASTFADVLRIETVKGERWRKWLMGDDAKKSVDEVLAHSELANCIAEVGGHYSFEVPEVKREMRTMFNNLRSCGMEPEVLVQNAIKYSIQRYVDCFGLIGLTDKIVKTVQSNSL